MPDKTPLPFPRRLDDILRWLSELRECRVRIFLAGDKVLDVTEVLRADIGAVTVRAAGHICVVNGAHIGMIELSDETCAEIDALRRVQD